MQEIDRIAIPAHNVQSLCWDSNDLVDWVDGGKRHSLDGAARHGNVIYSYRFDRAVTSPEGHFTVVYEVLGTKGLVLKDGRILREINRSYYHASVYEYPVVLFNLPDGRTGLAHCPEEYNKLEIEDAETGKSLTKRTGEAADFFQSRLSVSPDGKYLMSAGWIWHPLDAVYIYDIEQALVQPEILDVEPSLDLIASMTEINNAAFADKGTAIFASADLYDDEDQEDQDEKEEVGLRPNQLGHYSLSEQKYLTLVPLKEPSGVLMPVGAFAVGFFQHPKLIEVATGEIVTRWPDLETGQQNSSIVHYVGSIPILALDPINRRFAVADDEKITVIQLG